MEDNWIEYQCKSGQTMFVYNKVTGEHKWPHVLGQVGDSFDLFLHVFIHLFVDPVVYLQHLFSFTYLLIFYLIFRVKNTK